MHVCTFTKSMFFSYRKNGKISVKLTSIGWKHRNKEPMKDSKESNGRCSDLKNAAEMKAIPLSLLFNKEKNLIICMYIKTTQVSLEACSSASVDITSALI